MFLSLSTRDVDLNNVVTSRHIHDIEGCNHLRMHRWFQNRQRSKFLWPPVKHRNALPGEVVGIDPNDSRTGGAGVCVGFHIVIWRHLLSSRPRAEGSDSYSPRPTLPVWLNHYLVPGLLRSPVYEEMKIAWWIPGVS